MEAVFKTWQTSRKMYLNLMDRYSLDQLNKIPQGFNNNLIWNIGHVIVAQQAIIYRGSNLPMYVSDELMEMYKPGTKPTRPVSQAEVDQLKELLISLIDKTQEDYYKNVFTTYNERTTGTGFHLGSLRDAFEFNNYHEGLHLGYMMGLRKYI